MNVHINFPASLQGEEGGGFQLMKPGFDSLTDLPSNPTCVTS